MTKTHDEWLQDPGNARAFAGEYLAMDTAEEIYDLLEKMDLSRADLADRLGKSRPYISQLLNGSRNMTLKTLADIGYVLDYSVRISFVDNRVASEDWQPILRAVPVTNQQITSDVGIDISDDDEYGKVYPLRATA